MKTFKGSAAIIILVVTATGGIVMLFSRKREVQALRADNERLELRTNTMAERVQHSSLTSKC